MKKALASIMILALASSAFASVGLTYTVTDIGNGLYETIVSFNDTSDYIGSFATSNLVFTAEGTTFNQDSGEVDDEGTWNWIISKHYGTAADKALDTWYYDVTSTLGSISPDANDVTGTTALTLNNVGTGTAAYYQYSTPLLHIISGAGNILVTGGVARDGVITDVTDRVAVPEPATMSLLGVGAVALLRRRK